jgi:chaperonin GroES
MRNWIMKTERCSAPAAAGKCPLLPLGERLVVERLDPKDEYAPGIIIPEAYRDKNLKMRVVSVGPGRMLDNGQTVPPQVGNPPRSIRAGDVVLVGEFNSQQEITIGERDYVVIHTEGVQGVVE